MKTIVTHLSPDLDAIASVWLIKKYLPGWKDAKVSFVPAGTTLDNKPPDEDKNVIHVDTGLGQFDHHQTNKNICATTLVFNFLKKNKYIKKNEIDALERIVEFVNRIDHFQEVFFPEPDSEIYEFCLHQIIEGLKQTNLTNYQVVEITITNLEAILRLLQNKIAAEKQIQKGYIFNSVFGKTLALEDANEEAVKLALKKDFMLVVKKDSKKGFVRIKSKPLKTINLKPLYEKIIKVDKNATWYLHPSKNILLNGSSKNPNLKPSSLSLSQIIAIVKEI
jgi:hypothetical protein